MLEDPTSPHYGLEMGKAAGLPSGTIYPILARLERAGWIESEREDVDPKVVGRRARRYYKLTGTGEHAATSEIETTLERLGSKRRKNKATQPRLGVRPA
jgi:DNA-binding PadR family transcriptional regulator